jgi:hypothetical protein
MVVIDKREECLRDAVGYCGELLFHVHEIIDLSVDIGRYLVGDRDPFAPARRLFSPPFLMVFAKASINILSGHPWNPVPTVPGTTAGLTVSQRTPDKKKEW